MVTVTKQWTLADLHRLPDDGNRYELVRGALFVTPAPSNPHESIGARVTRILDPYAATHGLGYVYRPWAVMMFEGSQVEPDLMVRLPHPDEDDEAWGTAPIPSLVVEIASRTTRRRDRNEKRALYLDAGVPEYWIIDGVERTITIVKAGTAVAIVRNTLCWHPND
ncbi:MAG: Uma2 family endonuclease, partial [Gemmatimonadaceae bacterium]